MLEKLKPQPADKIIALIGLYRADPRPEKLDLGVGVYKDAQGNTPIMRAVRTAEARLHAAQTTKSYVGLLGDLSYVEAMGDLVFGGTVPADRLAGAQTPGGTGAIHQLLELVRMANPDATVWISDPTWPNHPAILRHLNIPTRSYRYFDDETCDVDFDGMMDDLKAMKSGDVLLLHGCCHNPTGANLDLAQWRAVTEFVLENGVVPMIDLAYQGFADGLEDDVAGVRHLASRVPQMLLAASCSKNFGLYRDRVGVAFAIGATETERDLAKGALSSINRLNYSFPPDHGAALVSILLNDDALRADWREELESMRLRMLTLRTALAEALRRETNSGRFDFVATHRGMFSRLGLSAAAVGKLRDENAIYMVGDSRVNIAGLPADDLDGLAKAIASVAQV